MGLSFSLRQAALESPNGIALVDDGLAISYRELSVQADRAVASLGLTENERSVAVVGQDPRVALVARADRESIARVLGLIDRGVPPLLPHPRLTPTERSTLLSHFDVRLLEPGRSSELGESERGEPFPPPADAQLLAVLFTSGSQGLPKGVALSHGAFRTSAVASAQNLGWHPDDRWLLSLPLAHIGGLSIVTRCLAARVPFVLPAPGKGLDVGRLIHCIDRERVTLLSLVPTQLGALLEAGWECPPFVRAILLGGASAPNALRSRARERGFPLLATYGMTETCSQVATGRPGTTQSDSRAAPPLPGMQLRIASDGRIEVKTQSVMSGYLPRGAHPDPMTSDGWFRTSDSGSLSDNGELLVHGRADDTLISGGENVHPGEVERVLESFPHVLEAVVFGMEDARFGQVVAVALRVAGGFSSKHFDQLCRERLASHRRPRKIVVLTEFALTPGGKRDRRGTIALALEASEAPPQRK